MDLLPLVAIALGLAMDAFSVAVATGLTLRTVAPRQYFRLSFHFGFFQFLMPILGWLAGSTLVGLISSVDHWIALALLSYVGGKMLKESFDHGPDRGPDGADSVPEHLVKDPTRGASLVILSVATSIDALAVGLTLALLEVSILFPAVVIGVVAAALTFVGLRIGRYAGRWLGPWMERVGGVVLIGIGLKILSDHLHLLG